MVMILSAQNLGDIALAKEIYLALAFQHPLELASAPTGELIALNQNQLFGDLG